jgi:hypothetical protein
VVVVVVVSKPTPGSYLQARGGVGAGWPFMGAGSRSNDTNENKIKHCTLKKTCTYGPNNVSGTVWALFRLHGPALAFVGCCGPSLTCVGICWPSLALWAFVGLCWPSLAAVHCGPSWAFVGVVQAKDGCGGAGRRGDKHTKHLGPKQRVWHGLGPFFFVVAHPNSRQNHKSLVSTYKNT